MRAYEDARLRGEPDHPALEIALGLYRARFPDAPAPRVYAEVTRMISEAAVSPPPAPSEVGLTVIEPQPSRLLDWTEGRSAT